LQADFGKKRENLSVFGKFLPEKNVTISNNTTIIEDDEFEDFPNLTVHTLKEGR